MISDRTGFSDRGSALSASSTSSGLLAQVKARGPVAWTQLVELCGPLIYGWCRRSGIEAQDARDVSQYMLRVTGLTSGTYALKINGIVAATLTAKELEAGVNLTALGGPSQGQDAGSIAVQSLAILAAVAAKEAVVSQWRSLSQKAHAEGAAAELKEQLSALTAKVEEADGKIREAACQQKLHFELSPAP